jgi:hypothetical protein
MCPLEAEEQPTRQSHGQCERRTQRRGSSHHSVPRFTEHPAMSVTSASAAAWRGFIDIELADTRAPEKWAPLATE